MPLENLDDLEAEWALWTTDKVNNKLTQGGTWRRDNPGEWAKLQAYRVGTGPRPDLATVTGKQMVEQVDAWLEAKGTVDPPPPPPPTGTVIFADTFDNGIRTDVSPPVSGYGINDQRTWTNPNGVLSTIPGTNDPAVRFGLSAAGGSAWLQRWGYRTAGWHWYGLEWYFAPGWVGNGQWAVCWEGNYFPWLKGNGPFALAPHQDVMKLSVQSGYVDYLSQAAEWDNGGNWEQFGVSGTTSPVTGATKQIGNGVQDWFIIPKGQMNAGVVHQVIVGVDKTVANAGKWRGLWRRRGEQTWTQTVNVDWACPTEWYGKDAVGKVWQATDMLAGDVPFLSNHGLYRSTASAAVNVYLASVVHATSLDACQARLP